MPNLTPEGFGSRFVGKSLTWTEDWTERVGGPCGAVWLHPDTWTDLPMLPENPGAKHAPAEYPLLVVRAAAGECCLLEDPQTGVIVVRLLRWDGAEACETEGFDEKKTKRTVFDEAVVYAERAIRQMIEDHRLAGGVLGALPGPAVSR